MVFDKAVILVLLVAIASGEEVPKEWLAFKQKFNKQYTNETVEAKRMDTFLKHKSFIDQHNQLHAEGKESFKLGLNEFSDIPHEEFVRTRNGLRMPSKTPNVRPIFSVNLRALPVSIDWRTSGYVTPVKNQGQCGSCWAFSATGALEGQNFKKTNRLVSLSDQNLLDCANIFYGNYGCLGGLMDNAFNYVRKNGGINTEASYPYQGYKWFCRYNPANIGGKCSGFIDLPAGDEAALQNAVATIGPISAGVDASKASFQSYSSGIYKEPACSSTNLDHAVLVVGYGTDAVAGDFWIAKNSWGTSWGEQGYIRMSRNNNNNCGIATMASYPVV